jgi:Coenzyme PQQ synthesis protein D (PqqD)
MSTGVLTRRAGLDIHVVDDGYVVYDIAENRIHYLNIAAAVVLELCDGSRTPECLVRDAGNWFENKSLCHDEVRRCLELLQRERLLAA